MTPDETWKLIEWYDRTRPVMIQHRDTECEVEQMCARSGMWICANPDWLPHIEYRVKPKKPQIGIVRDQYTGNYQFESVELTPEVRAVLKEAGLIDEEYRFTSAALKAVGLIDE